MDASKPRTQKPVQLAAAAGHGRVALRDIDAAREQLLVIQATLAKEYDSCTGELRSVIRPDSSEDAADSEPGREMIAWYGNHLWHRLRHVEAALERVDAGLYGLCADCGRRIAQVRLQADPCAIRCLDCQEASERKSVGRRV